MVLGLYDEAGLRFVGQAGSGFSVAEDDAVGEALKLIEMTEPPFVNVPKIVSAKRWSWASRSLPGPVRWCEPRLVCRVEYTEFTDYGLLRHPAFQSMNVGANPDSSRTYDAPGWRNPGS